MNSATWRSVPRLLVGLHCGMSRLQLSHLLLEAINPARELVEALVRLLSCPGCGLRRAVDLGYFLLQAVDTAVHRRDMLIDIFLGGAAAEAKACNRQTDCRDALYY